MAEKMAEMAEEMTHIAKSGRGGWEDHGTKAKIREMTKMAQIAEDCRNGRSW